MPLSRAYGALTRRAKRLLHPPRAADNPLEMIVPPGRFGALPAVDVHPDYRLRQWRPEDHARYDALIAASGMPVVDMSYWDDRLLEHGFFVIEHAASGELAASCMAAHRPAPRHRRGGALGWLAADPAHAGRGLGRSVSAAVMHRLVDAGYTRIYLETHDFRLPAIKVYLTLGWEPLLYAPDMEARWRLVCEQLAWPFSPEAWPR